MFLRLAEERYHFVDRNFCKVQNSESTAEEAFGVFYEQEIDFFCCCFYGDQSSSGSHTIPDSFLPGRVRVLPEITSGRWTHSLCQTISRKNSTRSPQHKIPGLIEVL